MAKLIVNPTSSARREIALPRTLLSIGRDPSNDVVLPDAMVSRRHAVIEYRGSQYFLRDCNSSNGSLVNGDRVSERNLRDGDLVAIGTARLLFREELELEERGGQGRAASVRAAPAVPRLPGRLPQGRPVLPAVRRRRWRRAPPAKAVCTSCGTAVLLPAPLLQRLRPALLPRRRRRAAEPTTPRPAPTRAGHPDAAARAAEAPPAPARRTGGRARTRSAAERGRAPPRAACADRAPPRREPRGPARPRRRVRRAARARAAAARRRRAHRDRVLAAPPPGRLRRAPGGGPHRRAVVAAGQALLLTPVARLLVVARAAAIPADVPYLADPALAGPGAARRRAWAPSTTSTSGACRAPPRASACSASTVEARGRHAGRIGLSRARPAPARLPALRPACSASAS